MHLTESAEPGSTLLSDKMLLADEADYIVTVALCAPFLVRVGHSHFSGDTVLTISTYLIMSSRVTQISQFTA